MKPRKHAEIIKAWADGAEIEFLQNDQWVPTHNPTWGTCSEYRIKPQKWEPKGGCYFVSQIGDVCKDSTTLTPSKNFGMEFEIREAAEKAAIDYRRYHRLYKLAEELNEGWEPEWSTNDSKFAIRIEHEGRLGYASWINAQYLGMVYFKDRNTVIKAIKIIEAGGLE